MVYITPRRASMVGFERVNSDLPVPPATRVAGQRRHWQRHFAGDGLAGALHHERLRNDMGLTIHYQLTTTRGDEAHTRQLVQQLRQAALDLPFQHVGEIVEFRGDQCDYKQRADNDPHRWLLIQARNRGAQSEVGALKSILRVCHACGVKRALASGCSVSETRPTGWQRFSE
jgi:hypothetical protein